MKYSVEAAIELLERTPGVLEAMLRGLSDQWMYANEGEDTWSPFQVVGHLIEGERNDWIPRCQIVLSDSENKTFKPFDRHSQEEWIKGKCIEDLLETFRDHREQNIQILRSFQLNEEKLNRTGIHPAFGEVTLRQHLSTWMAHDQSHLAQIARVLAKQYRDECGPWTEYLPILND